jgi:hypothetical protein
VLPPETLRAAPREQAEASRSLELPLGDLIT